MIAIISKTSSAIKNPINLLPENFVELKDYPKTVFPTISERMVMIRPAMNTPTAITPMKTTATVPL